MNLTFDIFLLFSYFTVVFLSISLFDRRTLDSHEGLMTPEEKREKVHFQGRKQSNPDLLPMDTFLNLCSILGAKVISCCYFLIYIY